MVHRGEVFTKSHGRKVEGAFLGHFYKDINPIQEATALMSYSTSPRSPPCNTINCRLGFNIIHTAVANLFNHLYFSPTEVLKHFSSNVPITGFVGL